ncbi:MAG: hypothetical protein H6939_04095 [Burkholderiales bacterium]|nr:hypothetical protein [Burkholderiales bacterium]
MIEHMKSCAARWPLYGQCFRRHDRHDDAGSPREQFAVSPRQVFGQYGLFKSELFAGGRHEALITPCSARTCGKMAGAIMALSKLFYRAKLNFKVNVDSDLMLLFLKFYSPGQRSQRTHAGRKSAPIQIRRRRVTGN